MVVLTGSVAGTERIQGEILQSDVYEGVLYERRDILKIIAYTGYSLLIFIFYGGKYMLDEMGPEAVMLEYILLLLAYACLGVKILMTRYTKKEAACGLGIIALAGLCFAFNRNEYLITNVILVFSLKDMDLEELLRWCFWVGFVTVAVTILASFELGTAGGYSAVDRNWTDMRYKFGYSTPNTCHMYLWRLMMLYIFGYYSRIKLLHIVVMMALNILMFQFTGSRTGVLGAMLLVLYLAFIKAAEPIACKKWFGIMLSVVFAIWGLLICYLVLEMQHTDIFTKLDKVLTRRLSMAAARADWLPVSLFGNQYVSDYNYIDCGWISMLLQWGVIWFIIYNVAMVGLILKSTWERRPQVAMMVFVTGIYGFGESSVMEKGVAAIVVFLIAELLYRRPVKEERIHRDILGNPYDYSDERNIEAAGASEASQG